MNRWGKVGIAALVLVFWFGAGLGPLLRPLLYTLTPLQRHYFLTYIASSITGNDPEARTEVTWIVKRKPGKMDTKPVSKEAKPKGKTGRAKPTEPEVQADPEVEFAYERDVVAKPVMETVWAGATLPFLLSADAQREGWTGLSRNHPHRTESGKLREFLRQSYFNDEGWWEFFIQPLLAAGALTMLGMAARAWLEGRRERHLWSPPRNRYELLWRWMLEPPTAWEHREQGRWIEPARSAPRQIEAQMPATPATRKKEVSIPAAPQQETTAVEGSSRPAPAVAGTKKAAYTWDESQGID